MSDAVEEGVRKAVQKQIDTLKEAGAVINEVSLPHTKYVVPTYYIIASSEASSNLERFDGIRYGFRAEAKNLDEVYLNTRSEGFGDEVKRRIMLGSFALSAGAYDKFFLQAAKVRTLICEDFDKIFEDNDVIVGPVSTETAFDLNSEITDPIKMYNNDILTISANMAGIPAASVPAGLSEPPACLLASNHGQALRRRPSSSRRLHRTQQQVLRTNTSWIGGLI